MRFSLYLVHNIDFLNNSILLYEEHYSLSSVYHRENEHCNFAEKVG